MRRILASLAILLLAACRSGSEPVQISEARAGATPPGTTVAAAYMRIVANDGDTLLGAATPIAERVEMHSSIEENGMMKMRPLGQIELDPGEPLLLRSGATHFMLIGLSTPLAADTTFPLTLRFQKAGERVVEVRVVAPGTDAH
ncbi:MAG: copper chaperone PCu(A)C [Steroidobacteraceae bacterium]